MALQTLSAIDDRADLIEAPPRAYPVLWPILLRVPLHHKKTAGVSDGASRWQFTIMSDDLYVSAVNLTGGLTQIKNVALNKE